MWIKIETKSQSQKWVKAKIYKLQLRYEQDLCGAAFHLKSEIAEGNEYKREVFPFCEMTESVCNIINREKEMYIREILVSQAQFENKLEPTCRWTFPSKRADSLYAGNR